MSFLWLSGPSPDIGCIVIRYCAGNQRAEFRSTLWPRGGVEVEALVETADPDKIALRARILTERCIATCTFLLLRTDEEGLDGRKRELLAQLVHVILSLPEAQML